MAQTVLPALLKKTSSIDSNARHGAIMAIGEVVHGLSLLQNEDIGKLDKILCNTAIYIKYMYAFFWYILYGP